MNHHLRHLTHVMLGFIVALVLYMAACGAPVAYRQIIQDAEAAHDYKSLNDMKIEFYKVGEDMFIRKFKFEGHCFMFVSSLEKAGLIDVRCGGM